MQSSSCGNFHLLLALCASFRPSPRRALWSALRPCQNRSTLTPATFPSDVRLPATNSPYSLRTRIFEGGELVLGSYPGDVSLEVEADTEVFEDVSAKLCWRSASVARTSTWSFASSETDSNICCIESGFVLKIMPGTAMRKSPNCAAVTLLYMAIRIAKFQNTSLIERPPR